MAKQRIYIGTYTSFAGQVTPSEGIYLYEFDPATAKLESLGAVAQTPNPSFMALSADGSFLYTVNELMQYNGQDGGSASAFAVDHATGKLTLLNVQPTHGQNSCHMTLDATGRWALVANYSGGSLTIFPVQADGRLGAASSVIQNHGKGNDPRQEAPHVHSTLFDPTHRYLLVSDLGIDQILIYDFDASTGKPHVHNPAAIHTQPGAGPRHMAFHPNGHWFYQINELNSSIGAYTFDPAHGTFTPFQTVSTIPSSFHQKSEAAEIRVAVSGKFLYASNRGHESVAVFAIDGQNGHLSSVEFITEGISWPRNFAIDRTGEFLFVGNQLNSTIETFQIDTATGRLTARGIIAIPFPVHILPI